MKPAILIRLFLCCFWVVTWGCGKTFQSITADNLRTQSSNYEGKLITISGIPSPSEHGDFLPATPLSKGYWMLVIDGVRCAGTVNFENEPRIRSMLQIATSAQKEHRPVTVKGKMRGGILEMKFFEGIRADTAWYKNKNPYYSYSEYYEWNPFAYSPNSRVLKAWGVK